MKKVIIVHGWGGDSKSGWIPWLRSELEVQGFQVIAPEMPDTNNPKIKEWVAHLRKTVGKIDENTYFVGHSIGCQTIMRYLEKTSGEKIGGMILIAPWIHLKSLESEEDEKIAKPWVETRIDFKKVKAAANRILAVFSDNDPFVPLSDKDIFEKELRAETFVEKGKGHLEGEEASGELPIALTCVLEAAW